MAVYAVAQFSIHGRDRTTECLTDLPPTLDGIDVETWAAGEKMKMLEGE